MQTTFETARSRRMIGKAARMLRNPELRQTIQAMRESALLGGDVFFANQIADLQRAIDLVKRADRSAEREMTAVHTAKPRVDRKALRIQGLEQEVSRLIRSA